MDFSADQILTLVAGGVIALALFYAYNYVMCRKETIFYRAKLLVAFTMLYVGGMLLLSYMGYPPSTVLVGGILLGISARLMVKPPSDSRYIPKHMKRAVIERDLPAGEPYDSKRVHFDHRVAYSKGGDTSVRNLRLLAKDKNLRKGAKRPKLRDFL